MSADFARNLPLNLIDARLNGAPDVKILGQWEGSHRPPANRDCSERQKPHL